MVAAAVEFNPCFGQEQEHADKNPLLEYAIAIV